MCAMVAPLFSVKGGAIFFGIAQRAFPFRGNFAEDKESEIIARLPALQVGFEAQGAYFFVVGSLSRNNRCPNEQLPIQPV